jgi:hypothetical protein
MGLPRTFVGFSSTDLHYYRLMQAWKNHEHIDFDFTDCQLQREVFSEDEAYIKRRCWERINMAGTYLMLIGEDTRSRHKYVRWEAQVAIEKQCRVVGVNINGSRTLDRARTPPVIQGVGAMFVPFSARIIAYALENYNMQESGDRIYTNETYRKLGYADA